MNTITISKFATTVAVAAVVLFGVNFTLVHADTQNGAGVFINGNGQAFVRGATVTATSTTGFTAITNLGGNVINWNLIASSTTHFGKKLGTGFAALANIAIGDVVSFFGKVSGSGSTLTVNAVAVKDRTFIQAHATSTKTHVEKEKKDKKDHEDNGKHKGFELGVRTHGFLGLGIGKQGDN